MVRQRPAFARMICFVWRVRRRCGRCCQEEEDRRRQVFYRRDRPASPAVTLILLALWLLLAVYLITHPDLISIIVLVVTALVAGFAIFVTFVVRRAESEGMCRTLMSPDWRLKASAYS